MERKMARIALFTKIDTKPKRSSAAFTVLALTASSRTLPGTNRHLPVLERSAASPLPRSSSNIHKDGRSARFDKSSNYSLSDAGCASSYDGSFPFISHSIFLTFLRYKRHSTDG